MLGIGWRWPTGLAAVLAAGIAVMLRGTPPPTAVADGPVVAITAPASGFKLRQGRTTAVRARVQAGAWPLRDWTLRLRGPRAPADALASGSAAVADRTVAQVGADALVAGETYTLALSATDGVGHTATTELSFLIPDPQYTLIPLEPGNLSHLVSSGLSMDASGNLVAMGTTRFGDIAIFDAVTNKLRTVHLDLQGSDNFRLSGDGQRIVFGGVFPEAGFLRGIGVLDLASQKITQGPRTAATNLFTTDRAGRLVAFQSNFDLDPRVGNPDGALQYFLYDAVTNEVRQLTADPNAIRYEGACPSISGTTPAISADGGTIALVTSASLGVLPPQSGGACNLFAYEVANSRLRDVFTLPQQAVILGAPYISNEGRWLSFAVTRTVPPNITRTFPALLDLQTGELTEPVGSISEFPSFDSAIDGDGSTVVLSTQADVDPKVGNADHNMEIVLYDLSTQQFTQVSETARGIGRFPGGCEFYHPLPSEDARVVAFSFMLIDADGCHVDGPQRNEADGFVFMRVRAVRKRVGNRAPQLRHIDDIRVLAGDQLAVEVAATDADGDPVVFFAQVIDGDDVPPGSEIEDRRDGTAVFRWPTRPEHARTYPLRIAAFDEGGGETFQDFSITVCSRLVHDGNLPGTVTALFESEPPAPCRDADLNRDGQITAADVVSAVASAPSPTSGVGVRPR